MYVNRQHIMYHIYKLMEFWVLLSNRYTPMVLYENNTKKKFPSITNTNKSRRYPFYS